MKLLPVTFVITAVLTPFACALSCEEIETGRISGIRTYCDHFEGSSATPYQRWFTDFGIEGKYPGSVYLPGSDAAHPENGAAIHWNIGRENGEEYLFVALAARASGWVAFGIAEAGGMIGADMALFEAAKPTEIADAYTDDERSPKTDDCPSDWQLVSSNIDGDGNFIMIEFKRKLDTGDPQDKPIFNDESTLVAPHRVIAAWGDSTEIGYHGLNRARGAIRFYGTGDDRTTFDKAMADDADGSFVVSSIEHEISTNETEYAYSCTTREDLLAQGVQNTTDLLNIIGFEPVIQKGNEAFVHHYIVTGYSDEFCDGEMGGELVYVWAPGEGPVSLPSNLGTPMFGIDGFSSFDIEVHYDNPQGDSGIQDSSGVRIFWTEQPREEQIGILSIGDPNVGLFGEPVGNGPSTHEFECPGSCSTIVGREVTVLREYLHMHETGARMTNEQLRDGQVVRKAAIEYWEFDQNGNAAIQQDPYTIKPGDGFKTTCYFNGNNRIFGLASSEEMCMGFLYYYPRSKIRIEEWNVEFPWTCGYDIGFEPCETSHKQESLSSTTEFDREFGIANGKSCDKQGDPFEENDDKGEGSSAISSFRIHTMSIIAAFATIAILM